MAKFYFSESCNLPLYLHLLSKRVMNVRIIERKYVSILIENIYFRIPQEKWHIYPAWLFLYVQDIIVPVISLSAITTKILMKKEMKRFLFGNKIHPVHE